MSFRSSSRYTLARFPFVLLSLPGSVLVYVKQTTDHVILSARGTDMIRIRNFEEEKIVSVKVTSLKEEEKEANK